MVTGESYRVGDLTLDVAARLLIRDSELVTLPPKTFELFVALVRQAPGVVSRRELMDSVWIDELVNDEALTQRVMLLRRALGDQSKKPRYIASVPRWGYRIVAPVEALARAGARLPLRSSRRPATIRRRFGAREAAVVAAAALAVVALVASLPRPAALAAAAYRPRWPWCPSPSTRPQSRRAHQVRPARDPHQQPVEGARRASRGLEHDDPLPGHRDPPAGDRHVARRRVGGGRSGHRGSRHAGRDGRAGGRPQRQPALGRVVPPAEGSPADPPDQIAAGVARTLRPSITAAELQRLNPSHTDSFEAYESYLKGRYA